MSYRIAIFSGFLFFVFSCSDNRSAETHLFPVDSLLDAQVKILSATNATLTKDTWLSNEQSSVTYAPKDSSGWKKELEIFRQLHTINKPVNHSSYRILEENQGDFTIRTFEAQEPLQVLYLKVYYKVHSRNVIQLEGRLEENNSMFNGTRLVRMEFEERASGNLLKSYSITGGQKMLFSDTVEYRVTGEISIPEK